MSIKICFGTGINSSIGMGMSGEYVNYPDQAEQGSRVNIATHFLVVKKASGENVERPLSIVFFCKRTFNARHISVQAIYDECIKNQAGRNLLSRPQTCPGDYGHCGNFRGSLTECRCKTLDRISNPVIRMVYEDKVIKKALDLITHQQGFFHLKLAIFACGGLHGEQVLLFRLVDAIKNTHREGKITLFLMERDFHPFIQQTQKFHIDIRNGIRPPWEGLVGNRADIKQFLTEISLCLPPSITVDGNIFGTHPDYILASQMNPYFKHHLLIAADIDNTESIIRDIREKTTEKGEAAIVLVKEEVRPKQEVARLCDIYAGGAPKACFEVTQRHFALAQSKRILP